MTQIAAADVPVPDVVARACGGFLAVSPAHARVRIGVTADSDAEVREKFKQTYARWIETIDAPAPLTKGERT